MTLISLVLKLNPMKNKIQLFAILLFGISGLNAQEQPYQQQQSQDQQTMVYAAELTSINGFITGREVTGTLTITVEGERATIGLNATGLAPDMLHMAHLHGFEDGSEATCPEALMADADDDGYIDLIETREAAGITMIPLHDDPVSLQIGGEAYPMADGQGTISYTQEISLEELKAAMQTNFNISDFDFDNFVVFIHGVDDRLELPETVESLPDVPARYTLPVACGEVERLEY